MRIERIDLNLFIVFEAIYRERSVTKVAAQLNLTQPSVSNALSRLRQTFDDPLFVRTPSGMSPTPVSESIIKDVRDALRLMHRSVESSAKFEPEVSDKVFHLGMNDLAESLLLPKLRGILKRTAPNLSVTSYYVDRQSAVEEMKAGHIDLLIDAPMLNTKELFNKPLKNLPYVIAMRKGHPLAKKSVSIDKYLSCEHIHVSSRRRGRGQVDIGLHALGKTRDIKMRVQHYLVADRIVGETDLLWTVPKMLADSLSLEVCEAPFDIAPLSWQLFWHKQSDSDPANVWIREVIVDIVKNYS